MAEKSVGMLLQTVEDEIYAEDSGGVMGGTVDVCQYLLQGNLRGDKLRRSY
jgi:hypothetical protein